LPYVDNKNIATKQGIAMFELDPVQKFYQERARKQILQKLEEDRKRKVQECLKHWQKVQESIEF